MFVSCCVKWLVTLVDQQYYQCHHVQLYQQMAVKTRELVQALFASEVLEEGVLSIPAAGDKKSGEGLSSREIRGFLVVNEKKLRELSDDKVAELHRSGALGVAYAQLMSMQNLGKVFQPK